MSDNSVQSGELEPGVRRERQSASVGLAAYVLPFLSSAAMVLWLTRPAELEDPERLRVEVLPESVESARIFVGESEWRGGQLWARLSPAQPEAGRRDFDNRALGRRLDAGEGQAWHLELTWMSSAKANSVEGIAESVPLASVIVSDAEGDALGPLEARAGQPLRALFAPPQWLPAGEPVHLLLWGRAPAGGASLRLKSDGSLCELALVAAREDTQGLPESLVGWAPKPQERK